MATYIVTARYHILNVWSVRAHLYVSVVKQHISYSYFTSLNTAQHTIIIIVIFTPYKMIIIYKYLDSYYQIKSSLSIHTMNKKISKYITKLEKYC